MKYQISDITNIIQIQSFQLRHDAVIENVLTDSRRLVFPATTLFFAINGPRRKGTDFIKDLYANEVRNFVKSLTVFNVTNSVLLFMVLPIYKVV